MTYHMERVHAWAASASAPRNQFSDTLQFPYKLFECVNLNADLISWTDHGTAFQVDSDGYESRVLSTYPGLVEIPTFANFRRQMREYGFDWMQRWGTNEFVFQHPFFQRGQPDLLCNVLTRRKSRRRFASGVPQPIIVAPLPDSPFQTPSVQVFSPYSSLPMTGRSSRPRGRCVGRPITLTPDLTHVASVRGAESGSRGYFRRGRPPLSQLGTRSTPQSSNQSDWKPSDVDWWKYCSAFFNLKEELDKETTQNQRHSKVDIPVHFYGDDDEDFTSLKVNVMDRGSDDVTFSPSGRWQHRELRDLSTL